ncbi:MAG TPA: preprotein translocase subunit SecG [Thermoanaerobaculia bacterium]|nr:preprotein translocase subunit SecG [Thermoanaerobaculia bacterium]
MILVLHILAAMGIIGLVLIQHGKGADVGAAFGSGSAGSVFGAAGSANFLSRATAILAVVFFVTSLALTYFSNQRSDVEGVMRERPAPAPSLPGQIPGQADVKATPKPAAPAAPASEGGKVQDIPK